jgi:hypothetical protein
VSERKTRLWAGIDAGKGHHWAAVVDETGATLWSKKIDNDESAILAALGEILDLADEIHWAVDISGTSSALLLALLAAHGAEARPSRCGHAEPRGRARFRARPGNGTVPERHGRDTVRVCAAGWRSAGS